MLTKTLQPANVACPPHASLRRWVVVCQQPRRVLATATRLSCPSRHCGRRPSQARRALPCGGGSPCRRRPTQCCLAPRSPCGGGSSSRRRPIQCCPATRHLASADTVAGGRRKPAARLLAAVGRRVDDAPYSVAWHHDAWRQQTLWPATPRSAAPHPPVLPLSLRRHPACTLGPPGTTPGVSRHCGRRPSPGRLTPPCGCGTSCRRSLQVVNLSLISTAYSSPVNVSHTAP